MSKIPRPAWLQPDDEVGVAASLRETLVAGDRHALALIDCVGFSNGFEFTIAYRSREEIPFGLMGMGGPPTADRDLVVSIEYAGGAISASSDRGMDAMNAHYEAAYEGKDPPLPPAPIVMPKGGGGGGKRYDFTYWCWPLPPDGPMNVTVEWPGAGIPLTTVEVDASSIRQAGLASTRLWGD